MAKYVEQRTLSFSDQQMFDLILDVAKYPEFLPWCMATRVKSCDEGPSGQMVADMAVGFKMLQERYTSRITFDSPSHIHVTDIGGPFKRLETDWRFTKLPNGCQVDFEIDFEFRSKLLEGVMGKVFGEATQKMMQSFVTRAEDVYSGVSLDAT